MLPAYRKVAMTNLPVHPYTKLAAIGFRRDGRPIWPIMGGDGTAPAPATAAAPPQEPAPAPAPAPTPPGFVPAPQPNGGTAAEDQRAQELLAAAVQNGDPDQLGDAGKKALVAERERAKAAEKLAADHARELAELRKQYDGLKPAADMFAQLRQAVLPTEEKTDLEKLHERLAAQEKATAEERLRRTQLEVLSDLQLGKEWLGVLQGSTYDEMKAYVEKLQALMPKPEPAPAATADPGTETTAGDPPNPPQPKKAAAPKPDPSQGARGATPTRSTSLGQAVAKAMSGG